MAKENDKEKVDYAEKMLDLSKELLRDRERHRKFLDIETESMQKLNSIGKKIAETQAKILESRGRQSKLEQDIAAAIKLNQEQSSLSARLDMQKNKLNSGLTNELNKQKRLMDVVRDPSTSAKERQDIGKLLKLSYAKEMSIREQIDLKIKEKQASDDLLESLVIDEKFSKSQLLREKERERILKEQGGVLEDNYKWREKYVEIENKIISMSKALTSPYLIFTGLLTLAYNRFLELDSAAKGFRETTKLNKSQSEGLVKQAEVLSLQYSNIGATSEEILKSQAALFEKYGNVNSVVKENVDTVFLLNKNLGVTNENAAGFVAYMSDVGNMSKDQIANTAGFASQLAKASGVPLDKLMEDVANASEEAKAMTGGNVLNLIKASAQARKLGVDLNKTASASRGLLNFNESINSELEASVLLGKNLSFMDARRKAFAGDLAGAQEETLKQVQKMGDFNRLNVLQQEALAKASGYSVSDLQKMIKRKEDFNKLTEKEKSDYQKLMDMKKKDAENNNSARDALQEMQMQSTMETYKAFGKTMVNLGAQVLLPFIKILTRLADWVSIVAGKVGEFTAWMSKGEDSAWGYIVPILAMGTAFIGLKKAIGLSFGALTGFGGKVKEVLVDKMSKMAGGSGGGGLLGKLFGGKKGGIEDLSKSAESVKPEAGKGFVMFMKNINAGLKAIKPAQAAKGILILGALAGVTWLMTKAFQEMAGIDWAGVFLGITAIGTLGLVAAALGAGIKLIALGALSITLLSGALWVFGEAAGASSSGISLFADSLSKITPELTAIAKASAGLWVAAGAIGALGAAFAVFGAGKAANGLGSFVGNLLGGDRIDELKKLAELGPQLKVTADAIKTISNPNTETSSSGTSSANNNSNDVVVKKLDELIGLLRGGAIAVNIDGKLASRRIAEAIS